jgi:hypothetical protein
MKLYIKDNNNNEIELKEIDTINKDCNVLLLLMHHRLMPEDINRIEQRMTDKIGKRCVIIDSVIDKVVGI